jgi:hypothetical protein
MNLLITDLVLRTLAFLNVGCDVIHHIITGFIDW